MLVQSSFEAFQSGRIITDFLGGIGASFALFKEAGGLEHMRELPNFKNVPVGMRNEDGLWVVGNLWALPGYGDACA